jgi:hypothetical protein
MRVEGRDLESFRERDPHLFRKSRKVRGRDLPVAVLDEMQVLDQQVPVPRPAPEQRLNFRQRLRLDLPPPRHRACPTAPPRMLKFLDRCVLLARHADPVCRCL